MSKNEKESEDLSKDDRIRKEIARLNRLFREIPKGTKDKVSSLISNAAFMTITLEDLQESINRDGAVSEYQNGEFQWGTKKSPEVEIYNAMIKNQMGIIKQLTDLMPDAPKTSAAAKAQDEFMGILNRNKNDKKTV